MNEILRIATRKSPLAMWQAEHVQARLQQAHPGLTVELVPMSTKGDKILDVPLAKIGGKGLFVKELEQGIMEKRADIAVHSIKDVPVDFPPGLVMPIILEREDPRDAFVSTQFEELDQLPQGARLGTSSLRRQCQIRERRPDLKVMDLRGNVGTRLSKLDGGEYDAIILASAGLRRLEMPERIRQAIPTDICLPAIGQGAIGIECREADGQTLDLLKVLDHPQTHIRVEAERAFNQRLGGGCQVPIAGFAELEHGVILIRGIVGRPDGSQLLKASISGKPEDAAELGKVLAEDLLSQGADKILAEIGLHD